MASLNTYLNDLSYTYYIGRDAIERQGINTSISTVTTRLKNYFGNDIKEISVFGSWKRDTALPRYYDQKSDIDILIVFDHQRLNRTPQTYREWLLQFANKKYPTSVSAKSFPTVRIDLKHITLDLVPAIYDWWNYSIPSSTNQWMITNPTSFNNNVVNQNTNRNGIVKPILRLIKAWNANANYPFSSYDLEQKALNSLGFMNTVQDGFFSVCLNLPFFFVSQKTSSAVQKLRNDINNVKYQLNNNNLNYAKAELHKVLPQ